MSLYTYISREQWGADPLEVQVGYAVPHEQFVGLVVHHTVIVMPDYDHDSMIAGDIDDICQYMRQLQYARPDLGNEVPYSFVFFEGADPFDVIVAEGRGWGRTGAHTIGYNSTRYGCALAGDYTEHAPTPGQFSGIRSIGRQLDDPANAQPTLGHRDVYATACPGDDAYPHLDLVQPPFADQTPPQEDDMPLSDADLDAIEGRIRKRIREDGVLGAADPQANGNTAVMAALAGVTVDPAKVAAALAPLLNATVEHFTEGDLAAVAKAVNDETARRQQA